MYVITALDAPRFALPGIEFTALAAPSRGSRDVCTWRLTLEGGLRSEQSHTLHPRRDLHGVGGAHPARARCRGPRPGRRGGGPAGTPIQLDNVDDGPSQIYVAIAAGFTGTMADGTTVPTPPWAQ